MKLRHLSEGRDAPLYHGTSMSGLIAILDDDNLEGMHPNDEIGFHHPSVRLSRSFKVAKMFTKPFSSSFDDGGVLELSQTLLTQQYKIVPFSDRINGASRNINQSEYEEVVMTEGIKPLSKYLLSIYVSDANIEEAMYDSTIQYWIDDGDVYGWDVDEVKQELVKLANHPLRKNM